MNEFLIETLLWILETLAGNDKDDNPIIQLQRCDIPKVLPTLNSGLRSESLTNKIKASKLLDKLANHYSDDLSMTQMFGSSGNLRLLTRCLSDTINSPNQVDLYKQTLSTICSVMSSENDDLATQLIDDAIFERLHAVVLTSQFEEVKQAMWALSNLAVHSADFARMICEDEIVETIATLLNSKEL